MANVQNLRNSHVNVHSHRHGNSRIPLFDITWKGIIESMDHTTSVLSYIGSLASILQKKAWKHNHGESNLHTEMWCRQQVSKRTYFCTHVEKVLCTNVDSPLRGLLGSKKKGIASNRDRQLLYLNSLYREIWKISKQCFCPWSMTRNFSSGNCH